MCLSTCDYEVNLKGSYTAKISIERLLSELSIPDQAEDQISLICLNLTKLNYIEIGPLSFLRGVIASWNEKGQSVSVNFGSSRSVITYMQRMNFFTSIGIEIPEGFVRHPAKDRLVAFTIIDSASSQKTDELSETMATCITGESEEAEEFFFTEQPPEEGYFQAIAYSVSELIKNVQQHSSGIGYIAAQHYPSTGITQLAIVDIGMGVKESFFRSSSPHTSTITSDLSAIQLALNSEVSSKTHSAGLGGGFENAGVGLTLLTEIAKKADGHFQIVSGYGLVNQDEGVDLSNVFNGTYVCLSFERNKLDTFGHLLENAKQKFLGSPDDDLDLELDGIFGG
jgi:hypothetical protein